MSSGVFGGSFSFRHVRVMARFWRVNGAWAFLLPGGVDPLPWDRLGQGVQACINSGGNIISLLTVLTPWNGNQIVVDAKSWKCTPPPGESVC